MKPIRPRPCCARSSAAVFITGVVLVALGASSTAWAQNANPDGASRSEPAAVEPASSAVSSQPDQTTGTDPADLTDSSGTTSPSARAAEAAQALAGLVGLEDPQVTLTGGVATVRGIANDPSVIEHATELVRSVTGAQAVESQITLTGSVGQRIEGAASRVGAKFERWTALLPLIPIAMGVLLVAIVLAWLVGRWAWPFRRVTSNPFLADIAQTLTQAAVVLTGVLLALEVLDATALVGGVLGAAGVAGIAIGFAFRDLVENYIASVLLSLRQPFRPRDHVVIDGKEGLVTSMNSRTTVLTSFDGNLVRIPNAVVFKTTLINYTSDPRRRFNFEVGVGYDVDLSQAVRVGVAVLKETEGVMADPEPFAMVTKLGDSSITVSIFGWVLQTTHDFGRVRGSAMQRVKAEFDRLDIDMPEPSYTVRLLPGHALAQGAQGLHAPTPEANGLADSGETRGHAQREAHPISPEPPGKPDVSADDTTVQLAEEAAHGTGGTNLLREDAPKE